MCGVGGALSRQKKKVVRCNSSRHNSEIELPPTRGKNACLQFISADSLQQPLAEQRGKSFHLNRGRNTCLALEKRNRAFIFFFFFRRCLFFRIFFLSFFVLFSCLFLMPGSRRLMLVNRVSLANGQCSFLFFTFRYYCTRVSAF